LNYTGATDEALPRLAAMPALAELYLATAAVTDKGVEALAGMPRLTHLNLYHTLVTEAGEAKLQQALKGCRIVFDRESALPTRRGS